MSNGNRLHYIALGVALTLAAPALGQDAVQPQERPSENQDPGTEPENKPTTQPAVEPPRVPPPIAPAESGGGDHDGEREPEESAKPKELLFQWETFFIWKDTSVRLKRE